MTGHDPDDTGDDLADARDDPNDAGDDPSDAGDAPTDAGDDTDGAHHTDEERPNQWPDDWTTADDDTHSPATDSTDDHERADDQPPTAGSDEAHDVDAADHTDDTDSSDGAGHTDDTDSSDGADTDSSDGADHTDDRAADAENAAALASDSDETDPAPETTEPASESSSTVPSNDANESITTDADESITSDADEPTTSDADESTTSDADESTTSDADEPTTSDQESSTLGERSGPEKPPAPGVDDGPTIDDDGLLTWFRNTNNSFVVVVRDVVSSVAAVAVIGLILFAISGIWPPLVAVESGSMEPHMSKGDLVFLVDENRYAPPSAIDDTGVSTYRSANAANGYSKFGAAGDVIVYEPFGDERTTPIIHRARFHVEKGENWVADANPEHLGAVDSCAEVPRNMCPAPYDGFITKGDANSKYDQVGDQSSIVKDDWVRGKAQVRIPFLGWIRLQFANLAITAPSGFGPFGALTARITALGVAAGATVVSIRL